MVAEIPCAMTGDFGHRTDVCKLPRGHDEGKTTEGKRLRHDPEAVHEGMYLGGTWQRRGKRTFIVNAASGEMMNDAYAKGDDVGAIQLPLPKG